MGRKNSFTPGDQQDQIWSWVSLQISTKNEEVVDFICKYNNFDLFFLDINKKFQKDKEYALDIKEDIDYFPVIQGGLGASASLFKPQEG